jgi:hypothetical protein
MTSGHSNSPWDPAPLHDTLSARLTPTPAWNRADDPVSRSVVAAPFSNADADTMLSRGVLASPVTANFRKSTVL